MLKQNKQKPTHIMVRFNEHFLNRNLHLVTENNTDTISEHKKIIEKNGYVWFGKFGNSIKQQYINTIDESDEEHFVFLIKTTQKKQYVYRANIITISKEDQRLLPEKQFIPKYYRNSDLNFGFWLKLKDIRKVNSKITNQLHVNSSHSPLVESLNRSTTGLMYISFKD